MQSKCIHSLKEKPSEMKVIRPEAVIQHPRQTTELTLYLGRWINYPRNTLSNFPPWMQPSVFVVQVLDIVGNAPGNVLRSQLEVLCNCICMHRGSEARKSNARGCPERSHQPQRIRSKIRDTWKAWHLLVCRRLTTAPSHAWTWPPPTPQAFHRVE